MLPGRSLRIRQPTNHQPCQFCNQFASSAWHRIFVWGQALASSALRLTGWPPSRDHQQQGQQPLPHSGHRMAPCSCRPRRGPRMPWRHRPDQVCSIMNRALQASDCMARTPSKPKTDGRSSLCLLRWATSHTWWHGVWGSAGCAQAGYEDSCRSAKLNFHQAHRLTYARPMAYGDGSAPRTQRAVSADIGAHQYLCVCGGGTRSESMLAGYNGR